jgi:23S rRNA (uracil1939-C5)-methyltransferase
MTSNDSTGQPVADTRDKTVWVHDLSWDGRGVARREDGRVMMIFGALPGDSVLPSIKHEPKHGPLDATIEILVDESPQRVAHPCPHYAQGCPASQLGAVRREFSLEWKHNHLVETLRRIGGLEGVVVEPVIPSPKQWRYRERLEFRVEHGQNGLDMGYMSHTGLVPIHDCRLGSTAIREPFAKLRQNLSILEPHPHLGARVPLRLLLRDNGRGEAVGVLFVVTRGPVDSRPLEDWMNTAGFVGWEIRRVRNIKLRFINSQLVISHGNPTVRITIAGRDLILGSTSFSQVNRKAANAMVDLLLEQVPADGKLLDLYSGYGRFALAYADRGGEALAIDSAPDALESGREYVRKSGLNVEYRDIDLGRDDLSGIDSASYDAAILDPPHSGADQKLLKMLKERGPDRLIYVSCHPAALARDLKCLDDYNVDLVVPIDMFPSTSELETLVILDRKV